MDSAFRIYSNVFVGPDAMLGDFVVIGEPPRGKAAGELPTRVGANAIIRSHTVLYAGNRIGDRFETGHGVLVREENEIGHGVSIGSHSIVEHHVRIGDGVRIHSNAFIPEYTVLETECWVGPGAILTNARYPRSPRVKQVLRGPVVRTRAKIGAGAVLLPGITIGRHALVGAGAVVVTDVPERAVVVGNPGKVIKFLDDIVDYAVNGERGN